MGCSDHPQPLVVTGIDVAKRDPPSPSHRAQAGRGAQAVALMPVAAPNSPRMGEGQQGYIQLCDNRLHCLFLLQHLEMG